MKKVLLTLALAISFLAGPVMADKVRIGTEGAYAPWNYLDDNGTLAGFEIDLGDALCEKAGLECEWVANEWDSMIPNLVGGNYDLIMAGMSITDERKQTIDFSMDYYPPDPSRYAAPAGSNQNWDSLSGARIGAQGATIQSAYLEEMYGANNDIITYETADQSIADLMAGNIDLLLADDEYLKPIVAGSGGAIEFTGPSPMIGGGVGIGMRKNEPDLAATMAGALEAAKADGTVDKLIMKYFESGPFYQ